MTGGPGSFHILELRFRSMSQDSDLQGLKVMVIDDSKTIRRTAENLLKKAGCEVLTAVDGFEALSKIVDNEPDVIFVDIMMPRYNVSTIKPLISIINL